MKTWTVTELRQHIGEAIATARPRTPLEGEAYGDSGSGTEGGAGILVGTFLAPCTLCHGGTEEDFGVVPWIVLDYGMAWAILPGIAVAFGPPTDDGIAAACVEADRMLGQVTS